MPKLRLVPLGKNSHLARRRTRKMQHSRTQPHPHDSNAQALEEASRGKTDLRIVDQDRRQIAPKSLASIAKERGISLRNAPPQSVHDQRPARIVPSHQRHSTPLRKQPLELHLAHPSHEQPAQHEPIQQLNTLGMTTGLCNEPISNGYRTLAESISWLIAYVRLIHTDHHS